MTRGWNLGREDATWVEINAVRMTRKWHVSCEDDTWMELSL